MALRPTKFLGRPKDVLAALFELFSKIFGNLGTFVRTYQEKLADGNFFGSPQHNKNIFFHWQLAFDVKIHVVFCCVHWNQSYLINWPFVHIFKIYETDFTFDWISITFQKRIVLNIDLRKIIWNQQLIFFKNKNIYRDFNVLYTCRVAVLRTGRG